MEFDLLTIGIVLSVLLIFIAYVLYRKYTKSESMEDEPAVLGRYKELDITMFVTPNCKYCKKLMKILKNNGLDDYTEVIDISKPEGRDLFDLTGEEGVPLLFSKTTQKKYSGYTKDIFDILKTLKA